jgi:hypothetical protein
VISRARSESDRSRSEFSDRPLGDAALSREKLRQGCRVDAEVARACPERILRIAGAPARELFAQEGTEAIGFHHGRS